MRLHDTVLILYEIHGCLNFIPDSSSPSYRRKGIALQIISDSFESDIVQTGSEIPNTVQCSFPFQTKPSSNFSTDRSCSIADRPSANSSCTFYFLAFLPCCTRNTIAINREKQ